MATSIICCHLGVYVSADGRIETYSPPFMSDKTVGLLALCSVNIL